MDVLQSNHFRRQVKKLHPKMKKILDDAVKTVVINPLIGQPKLGDLEGVYVHKFHLQNQLILLAYVFTETELTLLSFGAHENFYRDLKRTP